MSDETAVAVTICAVSPTRDEVTYLVTIPKRDGTQVCYGGNVEMHDNIIITKKEMYDGGDREEGGRGG